jgi:hypothetical protein
MALLKQIPTGTRFGRMVTVSEVCGCVSPVTGKAQGYVKCRCDCGHLSQCRRERRPRGTAPGG